MPTDHVIRIKPIQPNDNKALAVIIRNALTEFNAAKEGTVYFDETTDRLSTVFEKEGSCYFCLWVNDQLMGGAGIYPTEGLSAETCELVKLYLAPAARGKGFGRMLMDKCEVAALNMNYRFVYLETLPELTIAVPLYEKMGYEYLNQPLGNSGHSGCDIWMLKKL
jgi:putative acetyltransferase